MNLSILAVSIFLYSVTAKMKHRQISNLTLFHLYNQEVFNDCLHQESTNQANRKSQKNTLIYDGFTKNAFLNVLWLPSG